MPKVMLIAVNLGNKKINSDFGCYKDAVHYKKGASTYKMGEIKVTIGLCVKNAENTIRKAIKSIIDQDFSHKQMELIVVDGYSKDKTLSIIKEQVARTNLENKIFYENKGLGFARQIAVENARGDYIIWVDGDMILSKGFVRKQVEFMEKNPRVGIAKGRYGTLLDQSLVANLENLSLISIFDNTEKIPKVLGTSGSIYRVKALKQIGGFDVNIRGGGEDNDVEYRTRRNGWLLCITDAIFYEKRRRTWKGLWDEYFWHGYGGHYFLHKHKNANDLLETPLPIQFFLGLIRSIGDREFAGQKIWLFLPLHYIFKRIAWIFGFIKSHIDGYGHEKYF